MGTFRRPGGQGPETPQTPIVKATEALRTALENKEAKPEEVKAKLTALRETKEKAKQELLKAPCIKTCVFHADQRPGKFNSMLH
jgi:hypothetical protein